VWITDDSSSDSICNVVEIVVSGLQKFRFSEFRVTIREMKEKPYPPPPETPLSCVYQKTLSLILLSTTAHNRALSDSVRQQFFASSSARVVHRRPFCKDGPV